MSLPQATEQSPLLGQYDNGENGLAGGKSHGQGERGGSGSLALRDKQLSNARLALIMGSIWVSHLATTHLRA